jgi:hypothetical protein
MSFLFLAFFFLTCMRSLFQFTIYRVDKGKLKRKKTRLVAPTHSEREKKGRKKGKGKNGSRKLSWLFLFFFSPQKHQTKVFCVYTAMIEPQVIPANNDNNQHRARWLSYQVIGDIRQAIVDELLEYDAVGRRHSPWDEQEEGVGWVDNELGVFDQLRDQPELGYTPDGEFTDLASVERRGVAYLEQALAFLRGGGTGTPGLWELRATCDPLAIQTFFDTLSSSA